MNGTSRGSRRPRHGALSLPVDRWPVADRELIASLFTSGCLLDEVGPLARVRPVSRNGLEYAYARWLGWLAASVPGSLDEPPLARATAERFREWLASLEHLAPRTQHSLGSAAVWPLKAAAPDRDWSGHARILARLWRRVAAHRSPRKDGRVLAGAVLWRAALTLSHDHGHGSAPASREAAKARRNAAMVAFLTLMPIRRRAFAALEIGTSLVLVGPHMIARLEAELSKSGRPWEAPVPAPLVEVLADYLTHVRPWFAERGPAPTQALWLNDWGRPYEADHLSFRVSEITESLVGVRISPHLFRDSAATNLAYDSSESARHARDLLAHASFRTAERHYNQATMVEAGRKYGDLIARLKEGTP